MHFRWDCRCICAFQWRLNCSQGTKHHGQYEDQISAGLHITWSSWRRSEENAIRWHSSIQQLTPAKHRVAKCHLLHRRTLRCALCRLPDNLQSKRTHNFIWWIFTLYCYCNFGSGSSVGIVTDYGLDGTGSNPGGDEIFHCPGRPWNPPSLLYNGYRVFPGVKRPGRGFHHPPHLAPRLKEEYSYTSTHSLGLHGICRVNFTFYPYDTALPCTSPSRPLPLWGIIPCRYHTQVLYTESGRDYCRNS